MNLPIRPHITRPADLEGASPSELLDAWHAHVVRLVDARHNIGDPLPAPLLARHGLDALAAGQALTDQLMATRWVTAVDALTYGATLEHTAAAMGLEVEELAVGLRMWADGQHQHGGMSAAALDEVYALLGEVAR